MLVRHPCGAFGGTKDEWPFAAFCDDLCEALFSYDSNPYMWLRRALI